MRNAALQKIAEITALCFGIVLLGGIILMPGTVKKAVTGSPDTPEPVALQPAEHLAWWDNIGGCGVSGASGGSGGGAKWVGRGVTGGLLDMEIMRSVTMGGDYQYKSLNARFSYNLFNKNIIGVSFPFATKMGTYQYDNNESKNTQMISGFGNLGVDYTRKYGQTESGTVTLALGTPTGRYDHRRSDRGLAIISGGLKDTIKSLVTPELQPANGLFSLSLSSEYTIDKDWGPIIFGISYNANFRKFGDLGGTGAQNNVWIKDDNGNLASDFGVSRTTTYGQYYGPPDPADYGSDTAAYNSALAYFQLHDDDDIVIEQNYYTRDKNGKKVEPLEGDYFGNSLGVDMAVGYKQEKCVHSLAISYSYKLAMDWYVRRKDTEVANYTTLDKDNFEEEILILPVESGSRHTFSLSYGLEISSMYFPVFLAGTMTFSEKELQNLGGTIGVKGSFF